MIVMILMITVIITMTVKRSAHQLIGTIIRCYQHMMTGMTTSTKVLYQQLFRNSVYVLEWHVQQLSELNDSCDLREMTNFLSFRESPPKGHSHDMSIEENMSKPHTRQKKNF